MYEKTKVMQNQWLKYQLGALDYTDLTKFARIHEFERLVENPITRYYDYYRKKAQIDVGGRVGSMDIDSTGHYLLATNTDGSVSLWAFDDKLKSVTDSDENTVDQRQYQLVAKKLSFAKKSVVDDFHVSNDTGTNFGKQHLQEVASSRSNQNRYKYYRNSNYNNSIVNVNRNLVTKNVQTNEEKHRYNISSVKWYRNDNGMFFTGSNDCNVKIWDTNKFEPVQTIKLDYKINQLDTSHFTDNLVIVSIEDYYPRIIDLNNTNLGVTSLRDHKNNQSKSQILCAKFNPKRQHFIATGDDQGSVKIWDLRMPSKSYLELLDSSTKNTAHLKSCNDLEWNEMGTKLATAGLDGKCKTWYPFSTTTQSTSDLTLGDTDLMRNHYKKRTSQRLIWLDKYILLNTDYHEIHIFEQETGKLWNKIKNPLQPAQSTQRRQQFASMACQHSISYGIGLKLITASENSIIEYS